MSLVILRRRIGDLKPSFDDLLSSDYRNHPRYRGVVGHWLMNESGGLTAYDISGNGTHGTLTNGPVWTQGQFGPAISFDGSNDYVVMTNGFIIGTQGATVSAWVNATNTANFKQIFNASVIDGDLFLMYLSPDGNIRFNVRDSGQELNSGTFDTVGLALEGAWHHVVGMWDQSAKVGRIYTDGVLRATSNVNSSIIDIGNSATQYIGINSDQVSYPFPGPIDDVRIYNRALSAGEVVSLYIDPFLEFQQLEFYRWIRRVVPVSIIPVRTTSPIYRPTLIGARTI